MWLPTDPPTSASSNSMKAKWRDAPVFLLRDSRSRSCNRQPDSAHVHVNAAAAIMLYATAIYAACKSYNAACNAMMLHATAIMLHAAPRRRTARSSPSSAPRRSHAGCGPGRPPTMLPIAGARHGLVQRATVYDRSTPSARMRVLRMSVLVRMRVRANDGRVQWAV